MSLLGNTKVYYLNIFPTFSIFEEVLELFFETITILDSYIPIKELVMSLRLICKIISVKKLSKKVTYSYKSIFTPSALVLWIPILLGYIIETQIFDNLSYNPELEVVGNDDYGGSISIPVLPASENKGRKDFIIFLIRGTSVLFALSTLKSTKKNKQNFLLVILFFLIFFYQSYLVTNYLNLSKEGRRTKIIKTTKIGEVNLQDYDNLPIFKNSEVNSIAEPSKSIFSDPQGCSKPFLQESSQLQTILVKRRAYSERISEVEVFEYSSKTNTEVISEVISERIIEDKVFQVFQDKVFQHNSRKDLGKVSLLAEKTSKPLRYRKQLDKEYLVILLKLLLCLDYLVLVYISISQEVTNEYLSTRERDLNIMHIEVGEIINNSILLLIVIFKYLRSKKGDEVSSKRGDEAIFKSKNGEEVIRIIKSSERKLKGNSTYRIVLESALLLFLIGIYLGDSFKAQLLSGMKTKQVKESFFKEMIYFSIGFIVVILFYFSISGDIYRLLNFQMLFDNYLLVTLLSIICLSLILSDLHNLRLITVPFKKQKDGSK
jgi:hypothetical protein